MKRCLLCGTIKNEADLLGGNCIRCDKAIANAEEEHACEVAD